MRLHWHRRDLRTSDNPGLAGAAPDYPTLIVDHADARERAIAAFETARGES